jgi:hypothetical protein
MAEAGRSFRGSIRVFVCFAGASVRLAFRSSTFTLPLQRFRRRSDFVLDAAAILFHYAAAACSGALARSVSGRDVHCALGVCRRHVLSVESICVALSTDSASKSSAGSSGAWSPWPSSHHLMLFSGTTPQQDASSRSSSWSMLVIALVPPRAWPWDNLAAKVQQSPVGEDPSRLGWHRGQPDGSRRLRLGAGESRTDVSALVGDALASVHAAGVGMQRLYPHLHVQPDSVARGVIPPRNSGGWWWPRC